METTRGAAVSERPAFDHAANRAHCALTSRGDPLCRVPLVAPGNKGALSVNVVATTIWPGGMPCRCSANRGQQRCANDPAPVQALFANNSTTVRAAFFVH